MFLPVQLLEDSLAVLSQGSFVQLRSTLVEGRTVAHTNPTWQHHQLQVGKFCANGRTRSFCRDKSPKRCRGNIGRPNADSFGTVPLHTQRHTHTEQRRTTFILGSLCFFLTSFLLVALASRFPYLSFFSVFCLSRLGLCLCLSLISSLLHLDIQI